MKARARRNRPWWLALAASILITIGAEASAPDAPALERRVLRYLSALGLGVSAYMIQRPEAKR